ncbi:hypothetical protein [Xanthomonas maliensis]|uniref:hypothetical protein n=1 Tax=Xanthomonas maliensis TaxID=1321368 RepID=UPI0003B76FBC|nr:hypothetical protein [Xanthomonas maliensis]KAB7770563.1 hypothetical protein CKY51_04330 [Xanthomonas maliensis]
MVPAATGTRGQAGMVTPLAWISLLLAALGVLSNLGQVALLVLMPAGDLLPLPPGMQLPASWQGLFDHAMALSVLGVVLSALFGWLSWALLQRREWARIGFVIVLVLSGLLNFAGLALIGPLFDGVQALLPAAALQGPEGPELLQRLQATRQAALLLTGLGALAIACVHGALAWRLCTPAVRAEFHATRTD